MENINIFLWIIFILFVSCNSYSNQNNDLIDNDALSLALEEIYEGNIDSDDIVLIIPNAGCPGCISSCEEFMILNSGLHDNNIHFILTSFKSLKQLNIKIGSDVLNNKDVYLDKSSIIGKYGITSIYPIVVFINNNDNFEVEFVSPENPQVFDKILERLNL
ncbi:hypothetical protein [Cyclobacterium xiamenense]|uniref:hypothetical protein n=1 Tax=Cyclobacterium xiamenense TaxID=1297121 RepID=UPI0035CF6CB7